MIHVSEYPRIRGYKLPCGTSVDSTNTWKYIKQRYLKPYKSKQSTEEEKRRAD